MVKGTVLWNLNAGEIARRINVKEFDNLPGAKGVYVQEGVVAVLLIDGRFVTKLTSGVYYFDSTIERIADAVRHIWRFFTGRKEGGSPNEDEIRRGRVGSELRNLGKASLVEVILMAEGAIPLILGVTTSGNGLVFSPYTVKTKLEDIEVALSLQMELSDFSAFRRNYLTKQASFRIADLQVILNAPVANLLQEYLAYETLEVAVLPPALKERLRQCLTEKINSVLYGIRVRQIIDITVDSNDFDRFRELEHKLYCSNKELDYLIRTNEFKNRLAQEKNSQTIRETRSEEDLRYALQKLNRDSLLHDDEMEEFCQLLANQKAIREAQTDEDREKALQAIQKSRLIREDEFEDLQYELKNHHDKRAETDLIFHWQSYQRTETQRVSAERDIAILTAESDKAIEQAQYEQAKQELGHQIDLQRENTAFSVEMNDVAREEQKKDDDYGDHRWDVEEEHTVRSAKDKADTIDYAENKRLQRLQNELNMTLDKISRLKEEGRKDKAQDYEHELNKLKHEEDRLRIQQETERILIEAKKGMNAAQLAALGMDKLHPDAQKALAEALSSDKENAFMQKTAEEKTALLKEMIEQSRNIEKESREQQERTLEKLMSFMAEAMKTNASVVQSAVSGQKTTDEAFLKTMKDVATHRLNEVESDKEEARRDTRHAQARMDHAQDTALHYTTKFASTESIADAIKHSSEEVQCPKCFAWGEKGHRCPECGYQL